MHGVLYAHALLRLRRHHPCLTRFLLALFYPLALHNTFPAALLPCCPAALLPCCCTHPHFSETRLWSIDEIRKHTWCTQDGSAAAAAVVVADMPTDEEIEAALTPVVTFEALVHAKSASARLRQSQRKRMNEGEKSGNAMADALKSAQDSAAAVASEVAAEASAVAAPAEAVAAPLEEKAP